ncbi:glycosyl hydrolase family 28-related protein [Paenibacillus sp. GYB004]|uniref:right-handed parallel beta-helix repeat-containing protein n=1 Tax=Paenibacillus sp. GYB004 TaxID=2994393 RepID=UPI002F96AE5F
MNKDNRPAAAGMDKAMSRRKLLVTMGAAGALAAGSWMSGGVAKAASRDNAADLLESVFGRGNVPEGLLTNVNRKLAELFPMVNVKWFGALGNGVKDDTQAIQQAINFANTAAEKPIVFFPAGTYIVSPTRTTRIVLHSGIRLTGSHAAVIRVKNNAGDYETIFGPATNNTYIENVSISNLTIDQNASNNTTCNVTVADNGSRQYAIAIYRFQHVIVDNVRFVSICGINAVTLNGDGSKFAVVRDCFFRFVRARGQANYDNSAVYFNCENHAALGNVFLAEIAEKAYGAIETHNGLAVIANNVSEGYVTGVNVVSQSQNTAVTRDNSDITVTGNTFSKAAHGVRLWSITGKTLHNVNITNNTISLANAEHAERECSGVSTVLDLSPNRVLDGDYDTLLVAGNTIKFQMEPVQRATLIDSVNYAIGITPRGNMANVLVSHNVITNAPVAGIKVGLHNQPNRFVNIAVRDNVIANSGIYQHGIRDYCAAVFLVGNLERVSVVGNHISDTFDTMQGHQSFYTFGTAMKEVTIRDNTVWSKQGGYRSSIQSPGIDTGDKHAIRYVDSVPPTSGKLTVAAGDTIVPDGPPAPDSFYGYRATTGGTFGTLTGVTGTVASGTAGLTVNNASLLRVGDVLAIAGAPASYEIVYIKGPVVVLRTPVPVSLTNAAVSFHPPVLLPFGKYEALQA